MFSGTAHLSVGAGMSAAVGIIGRAAEADIRAGDGGYGACYTYSCSKGCQKLRFIHISTSSFVNCYLIWKSLLMHHLIWIAGAFVGCSFEGSMVTTRSSENGRFYGSSSISATDILLGSLPKPPAAASLYLALEDLYKKIEGWGMIEHSRLHHGLVRSWFIWLQNLTSSPAQICTFCYSLS